MAEAEIMAEEMQSPKKVAFANRKYTNEEKRKMEEEELEQMLKEQKGEVEEAAEPEETEPTSAEEKTFKKRYSDLRRHQQKQAEEFKTELAELKRQLADATKKEMQGVPKSDEDIEQWAKNYPDVAAIVETIAMKKAREQSTALEERLKVIDEMQVSATKEKAEAALMQMHPDFDEIRDSDVFTSGLKNSQSGCKMRCMKTTMTHVLLLGQLTSTKLIWVLARRNPNQTKKQPNLSLQKIVVVNRKRMKHPHT